MVASWNTRSMYNVWWPLKCCEATKHYSVVRQKKMVFKTFNPEKWETLIRSSSIFYWTIFFPTLYIFVFVKTTLNSEDPQSCQRAFGESVLWSKCYTDGVHPNTYSTNSFRNLSSPIKASCLTVMDAYQCGINECNIMDCVIYHLIKTWNYDYLFINWRVQQWFGSYREAPVCHFAELIWESSLSIISKCICRLQKNQSSNVGTSESNPCVDW